MTLFVATADMGTIIITSHDGTAASDGQGTYSRARKEDDFVGSKHFDDEDDFN
jgi:hypothetical protein